MSNYSPLNIFLKALESKIREGSRKSQKTLKVVLEMVIGGKDRYSYDFKTKALKHRTRLIKPSYVFYGCAKDKDLDVIVITQKDLSPGQIITVKPVAVISNIDKTELDKKELGYRDDKVIGIDDDLDLKEDSTILMAVDRVGVAMINMACRNRLNPDKAFIQDLEIYE